MSGPPEEPRRAVAVDSAGVRVPEDSNTIIDVLFDGRRIWSLTPGAEPVEEGFAPWPEDLRPHLDGTVLVTLRDHGTGGTLFEEELVMGSGHGRIDVVGPGGERLALNKWGELVQPFDSADADTIGATLEQTAEVIRVLADECGLPAFITYGTLLGAIREGDLIGHDDDVDVAYMSSCEHPADVARESFELQRALARRGWGVKRFSAGFLQVDFEGRDGVRRHVDVFTCFRVLDRFYQVFAVGAELPVSAILPLGEVTLYGRRLSVPAHPEALLEATYGLTWRVPDPSFQFKIPRHARRRINGWLGGYHVNNKYWEEFYASRRSARVPTEPSAFARWVAEREPGATPVVDVGSGTGRDSLWFARKGHPVLGLDYAEPAVARSRAAAESNGFDAGFEVFDLCDLRQVMAMGARLAHDEREYLIYGRFLVHALEDAARHQLWRLAEMTLATRGSLYLEFRTPQDVQTPHVFGEHFRRYLSPDEVVAEIEERGGTVTHRVEGHGLAVYNDEDPHICRLVAEWTR